MRAVTMSTSCLMLSVRENTPARSVKLLGGLPMNRWSYSTPADQFCAKENSIPVPIPPPQRVSFAWSTATPATKPVYLSSATAAPPLTYQRTLFQAYPTWPVNRPSALILLWLVTAGPKNRRVFEPFRPAQSPWASRPKTHDEACQR